MADNFITNPGSGGSVFASDDVDGVHYPRIKSSAGRDGAAADQYSISRSISVTTAKHQVKGSAGVVYGWYLTNRSAGERFIKFYNAPSASVTVGSTAPVMTICLAAGQSANVSFPHGIDFASGITLAATTGIADSDTGNPSANDVVANILYV